MEATGNRDPWVEIFESGGADVARILKSGTFPAIHSVVSASALLSEVTQAYAIHPSGTCQLLKSSLNHTYVLVARNERYIARLYGAHWRTSSEIAYELDLLTYLAAKGVSVSAPIPTRDGTPSRPLAAPEGTRYLVLLTYAQGRPLSWEQDEHSYLAGRVLATIHAASDDFTSIHNRFRLDLEYLIDQPLEAISPFLAHRPEDWAYLVGLAARLRERAARAAGSGLDWGVCHGDFGVKNIHVADDHTVAVFDFDLCGPGWRAYDFASVQRSAIDQQQISVWDAFVKGYLEMRRLAAADLAAVPLMRAIRRFWSLGLFAARVAEWGTSRLTDRRLDHWLRFFREWEAGYLESH